MSLMHIILKENGLNSASTCNKYEIFYYIQQLPNIKNYGVWRVNDWLAFNELETKQLIL